MALKATQYLIVHYNLKDLSITLTSKLQGSTPAPQASSGEIPAGCLGLAPRHGQPKYGHVEGSSVLSVTQGWTRFSLRICVTAPRLSSEVSSELPGKQKPLMKNPPFLFLLSLLWLHWRLFFQSMNFQLALPAQNAFQMVRNIQEISSYYLVDSDLKKQLEKKACT